ncbi:hypothetical protein EGH24_00365 [Halonotius terrestris]|uniref:Uncharacterized protein n=1 Tax=Halonotius terrestris TaxID=2487750 RepID=A0A8J8TDH0_9EURY|nr:hypothetical protein [Halonotius terrestris]TQQ83292.1 hypothetical protein EGH24_00365 [Halonotius terrestris]
MQQSDELTESIEEIDTDSTPTASEGGGESGRLGGRFSGKALLLSLVAVAIGVGVGGAIPIIGSVGSLVGVFAATFVLGILVSESRYLETAFAGGVVVGVNFALSLLTSVALPIGVDFFQQYGLAFSGVGVVIGVVLALVGHYFGRDLRDGLTREI